MKLKNINKSIFKPRNQHEILADLLETDIRNVSKIFEIYKKIKKLQKTFDKKQLLLPVIYYIDDVEMSHIESTGILGLRRTFNKYLEVNQKHLMDHYEFISLEVLYSWIGWVKDAIDKYQDVTGEKIKL